MALVKVERVQVLVEVQCLVSSTGSMARSGPKGELSLPAVGRDHGPGTRGVVQGARHGNHGTTSPKANVICAVVFDGGI